MPIVLAIRYKLTMIFKQMGRVNCVIEKCLFVVDFSCCVDDDLAEKLKFAERYRLDFSCGVIFLIYILFR